MGQCGPTNEEVTKDRVLGYVQYEREPVWQIQEKAGMADTGEGQYGRYRRRPVWQIQGRVSTTGTEYVNMTLTKGYGSVLTGGISMVITMGVEVHHTSERGCTDVGI